MKANTLKILVLFNLLLSGYLLYKTINKVDAVASLNDKIIKVRGLIVVDSLGVERVILASHLPDPQMFGYRIDAGRKEVGISGLMLYDAEGQERGGYVTDDDYGNIVLTLDTKSEQSALFLAEPQEGATLRLMGRNKNRVDIGAYNDTILIELRHNGKVIKSNYNE